MAVPKKRPVSKRHARPTTAEWKARIDLAAAHRLTGLFGWTNVIYNHISLRVPDQPDRFLLKPHELMFEEVTASSLLKLDLQGNVLAPTGRKANPGFNIHAAILTARSDIACVVHVHTEEGMAVSADPRGLLPLTQDAMHFYNRIAYHDYDGLATGEGGRQKLVDDLGSHHVLIMRHHGLLTCGSDVATAMLLMKYLVSCCRTQLMLQAAGANIVVPPPDVCEATARQWEKYYGKALPEAEWAALVRWADRANPGFRK